MVSVGGRKVRCNSTFFTPIYRNYEPRKNMRRSLLKIRDRSLRSALAIFSVCAGFLVLNADAAFGETNRARKAAIDSIQASEAKEHIRVLSHDSFEGREAGSRGGHASARYLGDQLEKIGIAPAGDRGGFYQPFGANMFNVLCQLPGSDPTLRNEFIVVGAHFDHVGYGSSGNSNGPVGFIHNGADDNASGVAGLLEIAGALKKLDAAPKRTIILAFWDGEEKDLLGARHWVSYPTVAKEKIKFAFNADMIGRLRKDRLELIGSRTAHGLRRWASGLNDEYGLALDFVWDLKEDSDHHCFFKAGIPVLMAHTGLHDQYHRPSDDLETIDEKGIERVSRFLLSMALDAADMERLPSFREASRRESEGNRRGLEIATPAPPRLGVSWDSQVEPGKFRVVRVENNSAAQRSGVQVGDVIVSLNGTVPESDNHLRKLVAAAPSASKIKLQHAGGAAEEIDLLLPGSGTRLGVTWREDEGEPNSLIVVQVVKGSAADESGIAPGDRIYGVGASGSVSADALAKAVADAGDELSLKLERFGRIFEVTAKLPSR
jgi:hypothetical protein